MNERRRVVKMRPTRHGDTDGKGRAEAPRTRGESVELGHLSLHIRAPLHEIFGGITPDELLRKENYGGSVLSGSSGDSNRAVHIAAERPHRGVHARCRDANEPHCSSAGGW